MGSMVMMLIHAFQYVYRLDLLLKMQFLKFSSSADIKSYFRGLEIHVQNLFSLSQLAT